MKTSTCTKIFSQTVVIEGFLKENKQSARNCLALQFYDKYKRLVCFQECSTA